MHIATSVVNRILNVADGVPAMPAPVTPPPAIPNPAMQSVALDRALASPPSQELPGIDQTPDPGAVAAGDPLLETLLKPGA